MSETTFFRLLQDEDKGATLARTIEGLDRGSEQKGVYKVNPTSFRQVPGSPFSYWVSDSLLSLFKKLPAFESNGRTAKQGLATADDFQFVRLWWEARPQDVTSGELHTSAEGFRQKTIADRWWVPFAKGGAFSTYYSDIHLIVNWRKDGRDLLSSPAAVIRNPSLYFHPGLTWPLRTNGLSFRILPAGCIFGHKGPSAFAESNEDLLSVSAILNSKSFGMLVSLQLGRVTLAQSFEVGLIQQTPFPALSKEDAEQLSDLARSSHHFRCTLDTANETSHVFHLPALLQVAGETLEARRAAWQARLDDAAARLDENQRQIDDIAFRLYGIEGEDRRAIEESLGTKRAEGGEQRAEDGDEGDERVEGSGQKGGDEEGEEDEEGATGADMRGLADGLISYLVGAALGRWDVRYATGERSTPLLPDPFAPLPVCAPGMLQGEDGLPLRDAPRGYPLLIDGDGILVDDPEHRDDIVRRVREVLYLLWGDRADSIEQELVAALGVKELRDYFRRGFFDAHIRRYSKSRRKAPIYWLMQSPRKLYGIWLYYQRLDHDMLFKALMNYAEPRIAREENRLTELAAALAGAGLAGREAKAMAAAVEKQKTLLTDLRAFRDGLSAAARVYLQPDHNDGVLLNIASLHAIVPWKEPRAAWNDLLAGKYEWSSIGKQLREKGLTSGEQRVRG